MNIALKRMLQPSGPAAALSSYFAPSVALSVQLLGVVYYICMHSMHIVLHVKSFIVWAACVVVSLNRSPNLW